MEWQNMRYSQEFKDNVVACLLSKELSISEAVEQYSIGKSAISYGVTVISDEIHGEFVFKGRRYTPFAAAHGNSLREGVMHTSTSKSFNTAGLQIASIITADPALRAKIERAVNVNEVCDVNPFGPAAAVAAYNEGEA